MTKAQEQALIRFLEDREHIDVPGNALIVCKDGAPIFRHFAGDATPDTLFRVYSMTKVSTVTAALQLMEQGLFTMDDPLSLYLPEYADMKVWNAAAGKAVPAERPIRVRDLFCMSAGVTYGGSDNEPARETSRIREALAKEQPAASYTTREFVRRLAQAPLLFEPGTHWNYSLCHDILGALIEVLSGQSFGEYLHDHIFSPLGMEHTFFRCPEDRRGLIATYDGGRSDDSYGPQARYESGGGGLLSTADDYMKLAVALTLGGTSPSGVRVLGRKTIDLMRMDQLSPVQKADFNWRYLTGYSYGLGVRTLIDPAKAGIPGSVGEFGWCGVLGTWMLMDPAERLSVIYMHQRTPNLEEYVQTHLRAMIYGML